MVDTGVVGCNWIELPATKFYHVKEDKKLSSCQYEVECGWRDMVSLSTEGEWGEFFFVWRLFYTDWVFCTVVLYVIRSGS